MGRYGGREDRDWTDPRTSAGCSESSASKEGKGEQQSKMQTKRSLCFRAMSKEHLVLATCALVSRTPSQKVVCQMPNIFIRSGISANADRQMMQRRHQKGSAVVIPTRYLFQLVQCKTNPPLAGAGCRHARFCGGSAMDAIQISASAPRPLSSACSGVKIPPRIQTGRRVTPPNRVGESVGCRFGNCSSREAGASIICLWRTLSLKLAATLE